MGITRRGLLGRAGVAGLTAFGASALVSAADADDHTLYMLEPGSGSSSCSSGCGGCSACRQHAAHSYFADADSADLHRAHAYCRCRVVAGPTVSDDTFGVLFGGSSTISRPRVDTRTPWVRDALADALVPPPDREMVDRAPSSPGPGISAPGALRVHRLRVWQPVPRRFRLLLELNGAAHVHLRLAATTGRRVGRFAFHAVPGVTTHELAAPNGTPPGDYVLGVQIVSPAGVVQTFERPLTIAPPRSRPTPAPAKFVDPVQPQGGRLPVLRD